jgi:hypothetical protein
VIVVNGQRLSRYDLTDSASKMLSLGYPKIFLFGDSISHLQKALSIVELVLHSDNGVDFAVDLLNRYLQLHLVPILLAPSFPMGRFAGTASVIPMPRTSFCPIVSDG